MKSIKSQFNQICNKKYAVLGFRKINNSYVRIIDGLLQIFRLKQYRNGNVCTVEFGILPLCMNIESLDISLPYLLDSFDVKAHGMSGGWKYSPLSPKSILSCLDAIFTVMDCELMPLFMRTSCSSSALNELIRLDEKFDQNRLASIKLLGETDRAEPWENRSLYAVDKYFLSLKAHNLQYAKEYLLFNIQMYENKLKSFGEPNAPKQPEIVISRFESKLAQLRESLLILESGNTEFFDEQIISTENNTEAILLSKYPQLRNQ